MIGGIFNVLGQAQQQAQAQQQKNMDAQNEMNRIMAMAGYKQNEADPAATQGGAGFMSSLKNTFGSTPYEFDPSQYAFDPNSPQGQQLELQRKENEAIKKYYEDKIGLEREQLDHARERNLWEQQFNNRKFSWDKYRWNAERADDKSVASRQEHYQRQRDRIEDDFRQQGLDISHTQATNSGYKVLTKNGQLVTIDFSAIEKDGKPKVTYTKLPESASASTRQALESIATIASFVGNEELMGKIPEATQESLKGMLDSLMKGLTKQMVEEHRKDKGSSVWGDSGEGGDDKNETTEDPVVGGPVDLPTTSEDGGTGEVTSSATRATSPSLEDAEALLEKISTAMAAGNRYQLTEEEEAILDEYGKENNFAASIIKFIERGVHGDKTPIFGGEVN